MDYQLVRYCETGTEGSFWCFWDEIHGEQQFHDNGFPKWEILETGTRMRIFKADGSVYWEGKCPYGKTTYEKFVEPEDPTISYEQWGFAFDNRLRMKFIHVSTFD